MRALVSGAFALKLNNGGNAWSRLSWIEGLRRLGLDVVFVEQIAQATDAQTAWFESVLSSVGIDGWIVPPHGPVPEELREAAVAADLLFNIGGHLTVPELFQGPRRRVYLDDDPGYTQYWHASGGNSARLDGHDLFFTFGANIGRDGCPIPTGDIDWRQTRPPIVLDDWPVAAGGDSDRFTTVATWRGPYGRLEADGRTFGVKLDEFRRFADLPRRCGQHFELALDIHPAETPDLELLAVNGWTLVDPQAVAATPASFRAYVQGSGGEFSAAQGIYVETGSGWFSDRTVRYLASGKPVLVQETGFSRTIPSGEGIVAFSTLEEAAAGAESIARDYGPHASAARALAEEYFDSDRVVGAVLADALA
jgi:hypothetical protein